MLKLCVIQCEQCIFGNLANFKIFVEFSLFEITITLCKCFLFIYIYFVYTDVQNAVAMGVTVPEEHITSESFVVQWDRVSNYNGNYVVRWYGEDDSSGMDTVNGLSYNVTGLTALTSYNVTVAVDTCLGAGQFSNIIMTMTNNESPTSPPSPTPIPGNAIICNIIIMNVTNKLPYYAYVCCIIVAT